MYYTGMGLNLDPVWRKDNAVLNILFFIILYANYIFLRQIILLLGPCLLILSWRRTFLLRLYNSNACFVLFEIGFFIIAV